MQSMNNSQLEQGKIQSLRIECQRFWARLQVKKYVSERIRAHAALTLRRKMNAKRIVEFHQDQGNDSGASKRRQNFNRIIASRTQP